MGRGLPVDEGEECADYEVGGDAACEPAAEKAAFVRGGVREFHAVRFFKILLLCHKYIANIK